MPRKQPVNLNDHLNANVARGHPAEFDVSLEPVYHNSGGHETPIANRLAIVRRDNGRAIAVVSDRYALVPHTRILEVVGQAISPLDVGPVPRGIYVDRQGARMRALFKFPALARPVVGDDEICPCLQVRNTYDGSARIALHIGAFRLVCTNLAVGGGGVFAGGFVSIHAGEIPVEAMGTKLAEYLHGFEAIVATYKYWSETRPSVQDLDFVLKRSLGGRFETLRDDLTSAPPATVFGAYNKLTHHATHSMRSARTAFAMLENINSSFQARFPCPIGANEIVADP